MLTWGPAHQGALSDGTLGILSWSGRHLPFPFFFCSEGVIITTHTHDIKYHVTDIYVASTMGKCCTIHQGDVVGDSQYGQGPRSGSWNARLSLCAQLVPQGHSTQAAVASAQHSLTRDSPNPHLVEDRNYPLYRRGDQGSVPRPLALAGSLDPLHNIFCRKRKRTEKDGAGVALLSPHGRREREGWAGVSWKDPPHEFFGATQGGDFLSSRASQSYASLQAEQAETKEGQRWTRSARP